MDYLPVRHGASESNPWIKSDTEGVKTILNKSSGWKPFSVDKNKKFLSKTLGLNSLNS